MKVTLDTNILVSAFISKKGNPARILELIATFDEITLVLSEDILQEFEGKSYDGDGKQTQCDLSLLQNVCVIRLSCADFKAELTAFNGGNTTAGHPSLQLRLVSQYT